jgi:CRISPR-associated endonuclease/helicase Cas3
MRFYAHTKSDADGNLRPQDEWEPLFSEDCEALRGGKCEKCQSLDPDHGHLNKVAHLASQFAAKMFPPGEDRESARQWGFLAGLWHDLGKFAPEWQTYLKSKADPHSDEVSGKVDHSTAGAQFSVKTHPLFGHLIAFGITAHHCGLLDTRTNGNSCQEMRLQKKDLPQIDDTPKFVTQRSIPRFPPFLMRIMQADRNPFSAAFYTRFLFSCLVDADFLATEAFMNPKGNLARNAPLGDALLRIDQLLAERIKAFGVPFKDDIVNQQRAKVVNDCEKAANQKPGLFTLNVPTGGGKTLSSLHFSLKHALKYGQKRIIYVVPFTSIIEQNAEVIREIIAPLQTDSFTPLVEHHASLSPEKETEQSRLATENWDAPIVITTAVQFFESLFAAKTSRNRKLHNIANAVIILDEAQSLPVNYLTPCLRSLQELADHYNTTAVLCTATQPAVNYNASEFSIGLKNCREIIQDPQSLFDALKRVELSDIEEQTDTQLSQRILGSEQVLCIVNRRQHAQILLQLLPLDADRYHLSALMCPEHRSQVLATIRRRLDKRQPVRLISTQLIEAGVDVDFPVVYRSLAGLDSIAQAAGRCNRNGKQPQLGHTYIFRPEDQKAEVYLRETAQVAAQIIDLHDDLLGREAIHHYFDLYYYRQKSRWDEKDILSNFAFDHRLTECPFRFNFRTAAENFKLIENWQSTVLIPFDEKARKLIQQLRNETIPLNRTLLRALQRYTVQITPKLFNQNATAFESLRDGAFHALISPELNYSQEFGLILDDGHASDQFLNVS